MYSIYMLFLNFLETLSKYFQLYCVCFSTSTKYREPILLKVGPNFQFVGEYESNAKQFSKNTE